MGFVAILAITLLMMTAYTCVPKNLHRQEHVFVWFGFTFVFVSLFSAFSVNNGDYLKPSDDWKLYLTLRIMEIVLIPMVILMYLDFAHALSTRTRKYAAAAACLLALYGLETLATASRLFLYLKPVPVWSSLLLWPLLLLVAILLQKGMRLLLRKEGVVT